MEKREQLYTIGGNVNWYRHCGKQYGGFSKQLKIELPSVSQSVTSQCVRLFRDPMNRSTPGLPVHQFPEYTQTRVH